MIYVDLLVIEDLILNYTIMLMTGILLNRKIQLKRILLASLIGIIPLIFIFIDINQIVINLLNFLFAIIMSIIAFKYIDLIYTVKNVIYMYLVGIFLAGSIYLINANFLPKIDNHLFNFLALIIISPIITYIYVKLIQKNQVNYSNYYLIDIYLKDKPKITINTFLDTGNKLIDPYTQKPIILINKKRLNITDEKIILVPYNTIDSHNLLKCIIPEKIYIHKIALYKKCIIGLIDNVGIEGAEGILNSKLLERI